ncbi:unnamed protein product [Auanema sp. JU1783]|nr:unnamed protein product [Auanema sp. JU1783]
MQYFLVLLFCNFDLGSSGRLYDVPITLDSDLRLVAPSAQARSKQNLPSHVLALLEDDWAKSFYEPACSDDNIKIVPVYYWPGDKIDLACAMCDIAFVLNGKVKNWGWARDIPAFLENPQKIVVSDSSKWSIVGNYQYQESQEYHQDAEPPLNYFPFYRGAPKRSERKAFDNVFYQHEGILSIIFSSASSQGVYFCFDSDSIGSVSYFYVLMAMTPPVHISESEAFTDGCVEKNLFFPHHNWQFHFFPGARVNAPKKCPASSDSFSACSSEYQTLYTISKDPDSAKECSIDHCIAELRDTYESTPLELNVAVELRWDEWSGCRQGMPSERREGHCYLVRKGGKIIPDDVTSSVSWLSTLNAMFDLEPFSADGIRLYSSLISWLIIEETETRPQCYLTAKQQAKYDDVFKNIIFKAMGYSLGDRKLENAFQVCLSSGLYTQKSSSFFIRGNVTRPYAIGSFMTETRPCD